MATRHDSFQEAASTYHRLRKEQGAAPALAFARALIDPPEGTDLFAPIRAAALVDCGSDLDDEDALQEGEREWRRLCQQHGAQGFRYNHANAVSALVSNSVRRHGLTETWANWNDQLREARLQYLQIAEDKSASALDAARACVNLGNSYEVTGRHLEALDAYERGLTRSPGFAMALANRGYALMRYSGYYGTHRNTILARAYADLAAALDRPDELMDETGPAGLQHFQDALARWKKAPAPLHTRRQRVDPYEAWCQRHNLLLHVSPDCLGDDDDLDPLFFVSVVTDLTADQPGAIPEVFFAFNTLKHEYATARWLAWVSTTKNHLTEDLARWSHITRYLDTLDYARYDLFSGLAREGFVAAVNLLDKVAAFLSLYIGNPSEPKSIYFRSCYSDPHMRVVLQQPPINLGLWALADLSLDSGKGGRYADEISLRHTATHRFLGLHEMALDESTPLSDHRSWYEFQTLLLRQLQLVRYALTYLVAAVDSREQGQRSETKAGTTIPALPIPPYAPLPEP